MRQGGTGQGLYMVRRYLQNHHGDIQLDDVTSGCSFTISLPVQHEVPCGGVRVLVVDDTSNLAGDIRDAILEQYPTLELQVAHQRDEALRLIDRVEWDIAVLDIVLGKDTDRSGIDLLRAIRQKGLPTKVIMVTAHAGLTLPSETGGEVPAEDLCRQMGARAFVYRNRPGTDYVDEIVVHVRRAIGGA